MPRQVADRAAVQADYFKRTAIHCPTQITAEDVVDFAEDDAEVAFRDVVRGGIAMSDEHEQGAAIGEDAFARTANL